MRRTIARGAFGAAVGATLLLACSSRPDDSAPKPRETTGSTAQADTSACIWGYYGAANWLLDQNCQCTSYQGQPLSGDGMDDCSYQQILYYCLEAAGYTGSCTQLPQMPLLAMSDDAYPPTRGIADFRIDAWGLDCPAQRYLLDCVSTYNAYGIDTHGNPYSAPPVGARFANWCIWWGPPQACGLPNDDIFDPCGSKRCVLP